MPAHIYVDESKRREYLVVAAVVSLADLGTSRDRLRELLLPRQPRLHFRDERDARKHRIISAVLELDIRADIYVADLAGGVVDARRRCLTALAASALTRDIRRIVIERDDGMVNQTSAPSPQRYEQPPRPTRSTIGGNVRTMNPCCGFPTLSLGAGPLAAPGKPTSDPA